MSVPAKSTQEPEPQPVVSPLTVAAVFLVLTISPGGEDTVRDLIPDLSGLGRSVGFRIPEGSLQVVTAVGADAWDRLFAGPRPRPGVSPAPARASCPRSASLPGRATRRRPPPVTCCFTSGRAGWTCASS